MYAKFKCLILTIVYAICCFALIKIANSGEQFKWLYSLAGIAGIGVIVEFIGIFTSKDSDF